MSRLFNDAATEYLRIETPVITAYPFALACKFRSNDDTITGTLMWVGDKDRPTYFTALIAVGAVDGDPIYAYSHQYGAAASRFAISSTGFSKDVWHHAAGVWLSRSERHAYIDGGSKGSSALAVNPMVDHDRTVVGAMGDTTPAGGYMSGDIAEAAIWDLTDWGVDDAAREVNFEKVIASLAKGFTPMFFPLGLKAYWPLVRGLNDKVGNYNLTANGTIVSPHCRVILPQGVKH